MFFGLLTAGFQQGRHFVAVVFGCRNEPGDGHFISFFNVIEAYPDIFSGGEIRFFHQVVDHALQAHAHTIVGRIDAGNAVGFQFFDFVGKDDAAAAAEYFDMAAVFFFQHVVHVLEKFHVAALVRGDGNGLYVFLNGGVDDFVYRAVVSEMNDFGSGGLNNTAHDVDGGIVAIKQRSGGNDTDMVFGLINFWKLHCLFFLKSCLKFTK